MQKVIGNEEISCDHVDDFLVGARGCGISRRHPVYDKTELANVLY
jgi:hypothetical protein